MHGNHRKSSISLRILCLEAVSKCGLALGYAVPELRADKEVVSRAVARDRSLSYDSIFIMFSSSFHHFSTFFMDFHRFRRRFEALRWLFGPCGSLERTGERCNSRAASSGTTKRWR